MDLTFFAANLYNPAKFIPAIRREWKTYFELKAFQQYDPIFHEINKRYKRKDKTIMVPDPEGTINPQTGEPNLIPKTVYISRIPLAMQRLIVSRATAFLTGGKVELKAKPENEQEQQLYDAVSETWRKNKLDYRNSDIAKRFMSETECAEIWYSKVTADGKVKMRCKVYSPSKGFELIPVFDELDDLIAFGLGFESRSIDGKKVQRMDVYDEEYLSRYIDDGNGWQLMENGKVAHQYGKIPVIYYNVERAIWSDVQVMIERLETLVSNFADTNDYNGSPILFAKGKITGWSAKGETGKVIEGVDDPSGREADLRYVSWDQAPESIKLEYEMLIENIYTLTQTPNISFTQMKGLGDISGAAFDRMMIDGHLKAMDMQNGMYGECIQRRLNFLCYALAAINGIESAKDMEISAKFNRFSIDDVADRIANAKNANGGLPVISHRESIVMAGLTDDPQGTYEEIEAQQNAETATTEVVPADA